MGEGRKNKSGSQFEGTVCHLAEGMAAVVRGSWRQLVTLYLLFRSKVMDAGAQLFCSHSVRYLQFMESCQ
jgi:hypothetical protein